jgi:hypothetical protein
MVECKTKSEGIGMETCGNENEEVVKEDDGGCQAVFRTGKRSY